MWELRGFALKLLPIKPDDYWRLTIAEFSEMLTGVAHRQEADWERTAWLATMVINISQKSVKKAVTVDQLLNRKRAYRNPEMDFQELMRRQKVIDAKESN